MNTHRLGQLYDQLTPRERLPLIMAAHLRGDAADQKRLGASAPLKTLRVPNYYPLAKALRTAVHWQMQTLLDPWMAGSNSAPKSTPIRKPI
jgi:hypothetical protein